MFASKREPSNRPHGTSQVRLHLLFHLVEDISPQILNPKTPFLLGFLGLCWLTGTLDLNIPSLEVRLRGTVADTDPLNEVPCKRAISRVKKGPLSGFSPIPPRIYSLDCIRIHTITCTVHMFMSGVQSPGRLLLA